MDLAQFDTKKKSDTGAFLHFEVSGKPLWLEGGEITTAKPDHALADQRVGVWLRPINSKAVKAEEHKRNNERLSQARVTRRGRVKGFTSEEQERAATAVLAAATIKFQNVVVDGEEVSLDEAEDFYNRFDGPGSFRDQVDAFLNDEEAFLGN